MVDGTPEPAEEPLARILARPLDRRTFLVLSAVAGPAVIAACTEATRPSASAAQSEGGATLAPPSGAPSATATSRPPDPADWVFVGGPILTMNAGARAEGLAIRGDRIVAIGAAADALQFVGDGTRLVDLAGRAVMPGFVDPHQHIAASVAESGGDLSAVETEAISLGITSRGEAAVRREALEPILAWAADREPRIRTSLYLVHNDNCGQDQSGWYRDYPPTKDRAAKLRIAGVKIYGDGGSCGAPAVSFDYAGGIGNGDMYVDQKWLAPLLEDLSGAGYQAVIHSLGDRALDVIQASMAAAFAGAGNPTRHRIDHNAVIRPDQLERYGELDLVALIFGAFSACLFAGDTSHFKYLTPAAYQSYEWRWRDLLDAAQGGHLGWHGDAPIFTLDPIAHLAGLVRRTQQATDGSTCEPPPWALANRLEAEEALTLMTIGAAYALDRDAEVGSLALGKLADLIVLDADPTTVPPDRLRDLAVQLTMIGGVAEFVRPGAEDLVPTPASTPPAEVTPAPSLASGLVNVAKGRPATASRSLPGSPPAFAVDGLADVDDIWSAGAGPPQWIEIDLGGAVTIAAIRLVVAQFPAGRTHHRVFGRAAASGASTLLREFDGSTADKDELVATFDPGLADVRFVRVETIESPSDIAWREIEILSRAG